MIKISLVVPVKDFIEDAFEIFEEHNKTASTNYNLNDREYLLEEVVAMEDSIKELSLDSDVIISRGITSEILKKNTDIPLIDIPVSGNDMFHSLHNIKTLYKPKKVGIIGSQNMIYGSKSISEIMGLEIEEYPLLNYSDGPKLVKIALENGCDAILGGLITTEYAKSKGIPSLTVKTNRESFWQAITEAKRISKISRTEQAKTQMHKTILDYAYEGVLSIDKEGKITVFNKIGKDTLGVLEEDYIGKNIQDIIHNQRLIDIIKDENEYIDEIIKYNNKLQLALNKVDIILKDERVGKVLTFQDITGIQNLEGKIREKIHNRGHFAKYNFKDIVYKSGVIEDTIRRSKKYSLVESNVLIIGDTGTGKELFAQSIHNHSRRKDQPFVALNCAALPENLLESELFGYVEGAFTGASKKGKRGYFELAHNGTIFLDEIGEIPLNLQSRLLRVLEEKEIIRIGDDKIIPIDVRVICATNKDLSELVLKGDFREDLFYRLDVLRVNIPPLADRREDIPLLVKHIIKKICFNYNIKQYQVEDEALEVLKKQSWTGNVRQLRNFCERVVVLNSSDTINLDSIIVADEKGINLTLEEGDTSFKYNGRKIGDGDTLTKEDIEDALVINKYNKTKTAQSLGISRSTLWRRIKEFEIKE